MVRTDLTKVDCRLAVTDAPTGDLPWMIKCREHEDGKASCAVYPDHLHCYGCGFHIARRLDSLAYLLGFYEGELDGYGERAFKVNVNKVVQVAHKYTSAAVDGYRERVAQEARRDPLPYAMGMVYHSHLVTNRTSRLDWLYQRGLTDKSIDMFDIGHDGTRFCIPFYSKEEELLTIRFRRDDFYGLESWDGKELAKYSGLQGRNASGAYLYPEWLVANQEEDHVVVVESELCVVRLRQEGIPAVCTFSGAGAMKYIPNLLKPFPRITKIWIAGDMDDAGYFGSSELEIEAKKQGYDVQNLTWDWNWAKDATELYLNNHTLQEVGYYEA